MRLSTTGRWLVNVKGGAAFAGYVVMVEKRRPQQLLSISTAQPEDVHIGQQNDRQAEQANRVISRIVQHFQNIRNKTRSTGINEVTNTNNKTRISQSDAGGDRYIETRPRKGRPMHETRENSKHSHFQKTGDPVHNE